MGTMGSGPRLRIVTLQQERKKDNMQTKAQACITFSLVFSSVRVFTLEGFRARNRKPELVFPGFCLVGCLLPWLFRPCMIPDPLRIPFILAFSAFLLTQKTENSSVS